MGTDIKSEQLEQFEQRHQDELSAGRYAKKKGYEMGVSFGLTGIGGFAGWKLPSLLPEKWKIPFAEKSGEVAKTFGELKANRAADQFFRTKLTMAAAGATIGTLVAGLIIGYEAWRNKEASRLAAQEINNDVSETLNIKQRTNPELERENERLREMLEKEEQQAPAYNAAKTEVSSIETDSRVIDANKEVALG